MSLVSLREFLEEVSRVKEMPCQPTIAFVNGCFDLFHLGHLDLLELAADHADFVFVGVNSDLSVEALKGKDRPIIPQFGRASMVAACRFVDWVALFNELSALNLLQRIQPDYYVKGPDYAGKPCPESEYVLSYGGRVLLGGHYPAVSTTQIINTIRGVS